MKNARSQTPNPLLGVHRFFRQGKVMSGGWSELVAKDRGWESFYRDRWQHDKIVRSTHGVNCTGACWWNVYVKDGLLTWESQAVDYPSTGPDVPDHEPRGCPRGVIYQLHAASACLLFALWPFSRLVHAWSLPFQYLGRPYILYRSRYMAARR